MRRSALIPAVLVVVAAGLAAFSGGTPSATAQAGSGGGNGGGDAVGGNGNRGGDITADDQLTAPGEVVGSGRENYYKPSSGGLPNVPNPGEYLYQQGCSTCHGLDGNGNGNSSDGKNYIPSLQGVGAAAVDFYVGTGRMPIAAPLKQAPRKTPVYTQDQIDAIAAYVSKTFGGGPAVPVVDTESGDLTEGYLMYQSNCAQCHNSGGSGGSLGRDYNAPHLRDATPKEIAEAIRVGPGAMPQWGENTFNEQQLNSIVRYVDEFKYEEQPGGLRLGAIGPVPEGYFAWFVGLGVLLGISRWIGTRV